MEKIAFLFTGQGSQYVGMAKSFYDEHEIARRTFEEANDVLGFDLAKLCFEGSLSELMRTENTQPALLAASVVAFRVYMQEIGIAPHLIAGHSLGEYAALTSAGALQFSDALKIVRERGLFTKQIVNSDIGGMTIIDGLPVEVVEAECRKLTGGEQFVQINCYNAPNQVAIAGHRELVEELESRLLDLDGQVTPLMMSAPYHTLLMQSVADRVKTMLEGVTIHDFLYPVIANVDGLPYGDPAAVIEKLTQQTLRPVQWQQTMNYLHKSGITHAIEMGPKNVLCNLVEANTPSIEARLYAQREDRKALLVKFAPTHPEVSGESAQADNIVAPSTPTEQRIADIWAQVLKRDAVSIHDNFFELGGHSLLATQVFNKIYTELHAKVVLKDLFASPTLQGLAQYVDSLLASGQGQRLKKVSKLSANGQPHYVLSNAQQRMYFSYRFDRLNNTYLVFRSLTIDGPLDAQLFDQALQQLVGRHASLRTTFIEVDDEPRQVLLESIPSRLTFEDISSLDASQQVAHIRAQVQTCNTVPFDMEAEPAWRALLFTQSEQKHFFYVNMHHIITDGWSYDRFLKELKETYDALSRGESPQLPSLDLQYVDYAAWQLEEIENGSFDKEEDYWLNTLAKPLPVLDLPTDYPRPEMQTFNGKTMLATIPTEVFNKLRTQSTEQNASMFMLTFSAYFMLLHYLTDSNDIIVGTPTSGRTDESLENIMGFFVNTLAIRTRFDGIHTLRDLLDAVKTQSLEADQHAEYPFDLIINKVNPDRDASRTPIFSTLFTYKPAKAANDPVAEDVVFREILDEELTPTLARFDVTFVLHEGESDIKLGFEYNTDLFNPETVDRFTHAYVQILEVMGNNLDTPLDQLSLLTDGERELIAGVNDTTADFPSDKTILDLFAETVEKQANQIALSSESSELTYAELNERINRLAHRLLEQGISQGDFVGLMMERSHETVISMLAVLKAGGVYVPIDLEYPADRIRHMITDSGARYLLTEHKTLEQVQSLLPQEVPVQVVLVDADLSALPASNPKVSVQGDDVAYVIYTSGSTGLPKGVLVSHLGVTNLVHWKHGVGFGVGDAVLQYINFSFDASVEEVFSALTGGARMHILSQYERTNVEAFAEAVGRTQATTLTMPTLFFNQLVNQLPDEFVPHLRTVKHVFVGGEALHAETVRRLKSRFGEQIILYNEYGPTEATVTSTVFKVEQVPDEMMNLPIGTPIPNAEVFVLNRWKQPSPLNVVGELYIGGVGLAKGYLHQPEKTAEVFVPHPFKQEEGARLYRTGDLARLLPSGQLEYAGRTDHQVKVRGHRVEIGEIEDVMSQHEGIFLVAVAVHKGRDGTNRLFGFYTTRGEALPADDLRSFLQDKLPDYMVPSRLLELDEMPFTPNGKIDRKQLEARAKIEATTAAVYIEPVTETETMLAAIWAEVLKVERVGLTDNFFDIGGHSLLAMQVVNRIRKQIGVTIEIKTMFAMPTLGKLAAFLDSLSGVEHEVQEIAIPHVGTLEHYALSHTQKRLWFFYKFDPSSVMYHVKFSASLKGQVDSQAFEAALQAVAQRHDTLRTVFLEVDGEPRQMIKDASDVHVAYEDLSAMSVQEQREYIKDKTHAAYITPFDLTTGPLLRSLLFKLNDKEAHFFLCSHHIITDGWSNNLIFQEWMASYQAILEGKQASLPELPVRFVDYAHWQESEEEAGAFAEDETFWLKTLAKPLPVLELPTDYARPKIQTYNGSSLKVALPSELFARLNELAKREEVSMYMLMLTAYVMLLHHLSKDEDIIVGTPVVGRTHELLEPIVGFFANTLAIRVRFDEEVRSFKDLLQQVKSQTLDAYQHQTYPFDLLVEKVNPERDMSRSPIFSTMFGYLKQLLDKNDHAELVGAHEAQVESAKFDFSLYAMEVNEEMLLGFEFNTDLFKRETVERISEMMQQVLAAFVNDLEAPLYSAEWLTDSDRAVYAAMNSTDADFDLDQLLHEAFIGQAEAHPERIALIDGDRVLTYGEMHERSNRLAHFLRAQGVQRNQLVGIMMERSIELLVGMYGILKAGAAYVPIDPEYPVQRVQYMLSDSAAPVLLSKQMYSEQIVEIASGIDLSTVLYMDLDVEQVAPVREGVTTYVWQDLSEQPTETPVKIGETSDMAYMIYTSGSTGRPKGVVIRHTAIVNRLLWHQTVFAATPDDCMIQRTTHCFDDSIVELFWPLRHGSRLLILPRSVYTNPELLVEQMLEHNVTYMQFVPALFSILVAYLQELKTEDRPNLKLRNFIVSGEALPSKLVNQWFEMYPTGARIGNLYGPTEAAVDVTAFIIDGPIDFVHIGQPLANTQCYIVNPGGHLCPVGVKGELLVGGIQLAEGYHNQPEKTAEAFIPNHLPGTPGDRLYRTGDLARILPDGTIEYLGRIDNQVKVRGFRIELGEIEEVFSQHPDVEMASVVVKKAADGNNMLFGYYTALQGTVEQAELKEFIGQQLTEYMVPTRIVKLDDMPLTPNGKIDRKALEQMAAADEFEITREFIAPVTETQQTLARIWAAILKREEISLNDNFFELGGHSLLAIQVLNRLTKELNVTIELKDVFLYATLELMASHVDELLAAGQTSEAVQITRQPVQPHYELSHAQQRLWILYKFDPTSKVYIVPITIRFTERINVAAFEAALHSLAQRHESLRTVFVEVDDVPRQVVQPESSLQLVYHDLSGWESDRQLDFIRSSIDESMDLPFDLTQGPLVRATLFKRSEEDYHFFLNLHHIITDGWSNNLLLKDLSTAYYALAAGQEPNWEPLDVQYADFAAWQNKELASGKWEQQEQALLNTFAKPLPVLELPTDFPRPDVMTYNGDLLRAAVPQEIAEQLRAMSKREDVSLYMLMLSAYVMLLHYLTEDNDIIVGTPVAGRSVESLESIIGFFVNTVAIRTRLDDVQSLHDLLQVVKGQFLSAYESQSYPFDMLIEKLNPERNTARTPLFSAMFTLYSNAQKEQATGLLPYEDAAEDLGHPISKFDLTLFVRDAADEMTLMFEYNTDLFKRETMERFAGIFQNVLQAFVSQLNAPIGTLDLLSASDRAVYAQLNASQMPYEADKPIHEVFYEQAAIHADRIAVTGEHGEMTYRELNERTNQLAHLLRAKGVGTNEIVGIMMDRSVDVIIAMLGILKAGGAYTAIDPTYPEERVKYMLGDSGMRLMLIHEQFVDRLPEGMCETLLLSDVPADLSVEDLTVTNTSSDLAYVIYTSGSTGVPKGTLIRHEGVVNLVQWTSDLFDIHDNDTFMQFASFSFDASVWEVFGPLLKGSRTHVLTDQQRLSIENFSDVIERSGATTAFMPTAFLNQFAMHIADSDVGKWKSIKRILAGGEAGLVGIFQGFQDRFGTDIEVVHVYGPTEATVYTTYYRIGSLSNMPPTVPIGRPLSNAELFVMNRHMQVVPVNVPGELYIESVGLAAGYLNQPEKTAEVFVPHPLKPGKMLYKTGDIVRLMPDGEIEFVTRRDSQIKVRGFRVEIGEIEERMLQHEDVKTAAVLAKRDASGANNLIAFYTTSGAQLPAGKFRSFLSDKMPAYMIPSIFVQLDEMPLSPNGKIDRKVLVQIEIAETFDFDKEFIAPSTPNQQKLAQIWASIFKREQIGLTDHFFDLGGHSLLAIQLMNRMSKEMNVTVEMKDLFTYATLEQLAAHVDRIEEEGHSQAVQIASLEPQEHYELSHAQKRLWFLYKFDPSTNVYDVPNMVQLKSELDVPTFAAALQHVVDRHASLRTTFIEVNGTPRQVVQAACGFELPFRDISGLGRTEQREFIQFKVDSLNAKPFDLTAGPLMRAALFKVGAAEYRFYLNIHHIVTDGWSFDVLFADLSDAYHALLRGDQPNAEPLAVQYVDYAAWQNAEHESDKWQHREEFWLNTLAKPLPVLELPTDYTRPEIMTFNGDAVLTSVPHELAEQLRALAKQEDVSFYMMMLSTYVMLLHHLTDDDDIIVGTPVAGRTVDELESLIGFFVNTLAIRTRLDGVQSLQDLLQAVKGQFLNAYENQAYPFDLLVEKVNPDRDPSRAPLFSTMFSFLTRGKAEPREGVLNFEPAEEQVMHAISKFDLTLVVIDGPEEMRLVFEYNTDLFKRATIERFETIFQNVLHAFATSLTAPLAALELLSPDDQQLYAQINETAIPFDGDKTIPELFYEQAALYPDRPALSDEHGALSFAEANARSNQLAHVLRGKGVGANQVVGIMMERSKDVIIAMLGVLKAGGAYVALDPAYPEDRVQYMLSDSGANLLLTEAHLHQHLAEERFETLYLADVPAETSTENLPIFTAPHDLAYVIYTSGSTGVPKGTLLHHVGVANLAQWKRQQMKPGERDVTLQFASYSFDASVWEVFPAMLNGGEVFILNGDQRQTITAFADAAAAKQATTVTLPTVFFNQLGMYVSDEDVAKFASLKRIYVAGEALQPEVVRAWQRRFGTSIDIINAYGPTEATVCVTIYPIGELLSEEVVNISIGQPILNTSVYVMNRHLQLCPVNVPGELYLESVGLAIGYLNQPEKTAEAFIPHPLKPGKVLYKTGDIGRLLPSGDIEYIGRRDAQVKVRGYRIEIGEIEERLMQHEALEVAAVVAKKDVSGNNTLIAYYTTHGEQIGATELRSYLAQKMPAFMVPSQFVQLEQMPLMPNGKVDRKALLTLKVQHAVKQARREVAATVAAPSHDLSSLQERIAAVWAEVLEKDPAEIDADDNFFDIGGHSMLLIKIQDGIKRDLNVDMPLTDLFKYTTVHMLAEALGGSTRVAQTTRVQARQQQAEDERVAIIGIGLRFPEAKNTYQFWKNLREGKELVKDIAPENFPYSLDEMDPELRERLILRGAYLENVDQFDPTFFQMTRKEASHLDPQQRLFLMCAWEAIENSGYNIEEINTAMSLYAGISDNKYPPVEKTGGNASDKFNSGLANRQFMSTRVSYKLNLKGESMVIDTACSTSLVAVHMACQSLLSGQADYALAGGACIQTPQHTGYVYEPGMILSPDGKCRAFDKDAGGTLPGNGVGVVLLKRLSDAQRDGDPIYAVIKGSAINNDGNVKVGFTAPSQTGQAEVIRKAQEAAGVDPSTITYIETHGTGTHLGDPIEVAALKEAFGPQAETGYCAIGSVKSNLGHTDTAAGVASLIKAALSIKYGELVPSLHFTEPNPECGFENSPFYVNTTTKPWSNEKGPRRAGVSSFGIGGTNAHVILEECPKVVK